MCDSCSALTAAFTADELFGWRNKTEHGCQDIGARGDKHNMSVVVYVKVDGRRKPELQQQAWKWNALVTRRISSNVSVSVSVSVFVFVPVSICVSVCASTSVRVCVYA